MVLTRCQWTLDRPSVLKQKEQQQAEREAIRKQTEKQKKASMQANAQTVANFWLAFEQDLYILPVLNKIDLDTAKPDDVANQLNNLFEIPLEDSLRVSAKSGLGMPELLEAICQRFPSPAGNRSSPLKALVFDSWFIKFRGVHAAVIIKDGCLKKGQKITCLAKGVTFQVQEVGVMYPDPVPVPVLYAGQVGYFTANIQNVTDVPVGDTVCLTSDPVTPLPGFRAMKPVVYAGVYPVETKEYDELRNAVERLALNDAALTLELESSPSLGQGWRVGFLGLLHMEIFSQRLEQEYDASVILTSPSVPFKVFLQNDPGLRKRYGFLPNSNEPAVITLVDPNQFPDHKDVDHFEEPIVLATIITPEESMGKLMKLCNAHRGRQKDMRYMDSNTIVIEYYLPLMEVIVDFHDKLKRESSGYGSFDYEPAGYEPVDLVRLDVALNKNMVNEFSSIVTREASRTKGRELALRLKELLPRQQYEIAIQAKVGTKVIARENVKAYRKDVAAKLYGGDTSRLKKLLARQKEGKSRIKMVSNIEIPKDVFLKVLKR